ncbi:MAG TPA: caspase family protein [Polyangiaceae bacterium]
MSIDDHAIVVGIDHYHGNGLRPLCGARNDAYSFSKWLRDGGHVPEGQIRLVLSSEDEDTPNKDMIEDEFVKFILEFEKTKKKGRRLYMFFSGHGIELGDFSEDGHVLVLMANATSDLLGRSVAPLRAARMFRHCAIFEEVVLFADCCRTPASADVPSDFAFEAILARLKRVNQGKLIFGFGARWSFDAREQMLPDDVGEGHIPRGVFTYALMDGLKAAEDRDNPGFITGSSLKAYLDCRMPLISGLSDRPRIDGDLDLVIAPTRVPRVTVNLTLTRPVETFQVRHGLNIERTISVELTDLGGNRYCAELARGLYLFGFFGPDGVVSGKTVAVDADGPINVEI